MGKLICVATTVPISESLRLRLGARRIRARQLQAWVAPGHMASPVRILAVSRGLEVSALADFVGEEEEEDGS